MYDIAAKLDLEDRYREEAELKAAREATVCELSDREREIISGL